MTFKAKPRKREVMFGVKFYENKAEIKEALEANLEDYSTTCKDLNCQGSLSDPN